MQKLLVECPNNEGDDDGNGSESSTTNPICEEKICYTRTDQPLLIPEFNPLTLNVGIQCCITAKTFVNAETQTDDCYLRPLGNTINTGSCYPQSPTYFGWQSVETHAFGFPSSARHFSMRETVLTFSC